MKFPVADLAPVRAALGRAGAEPRGSVLQSDTYFDTPEGTLLTGDRGLRLRVEKGSGTFSLSPEGHKPGAGETARTGTIQKRFLTPFAPFALHDARASMHALLTYKGPRQKHGRAKIRREIQTRVEDGAALAAILTDLGLCRRFVLQKRRQSFRLGRCLVELDELPLLGLFVEIEGTSVAAIESVCRRLALEGEPVRDSYVQLTLKACPRAGRRCLEVTFRRCAACRFR